MNYRRKQSGFTLIEMMIALVLGLIVIAAVVNMYVGSSRSSKFTSGLQTMQENGRSGVSILQRGFRLAGYSPNSRIDPIDISKSGETSVTVVMQTPYDCNGNDTSTSTNPGFAANTYAWDSTKLTITCRGDNPKSVAMPYVEGVDSFRILYGVDSDDNQVPDKYVSFDSGISPRQIVGVRFAMLVNSGSPIRTRASKEDHVVLDESVPKNDRYARHVFGGTVLLRNRL